MQPSSASTLQTHPIPIRIDHAPELVPDVIYEIFRHLSVGEICHARMVCKVWSKVDWNDSRLLKVLKKLGMVFGKVEWSEYFGDVGEEPHLPPDIGKILWTPSIGVEGYEGKRVWESHLLTLIPAKVDGKYFCLNLLGDLIRNPKQGSKTGYDAYPDSVKNPHGSNCFTESHWVMMTRNVLVGSRNKKYLTQVDRVETFAKQTGKPFFEPNALIAATCILMHHVQSGERLYNNSPWTFTRCQEKSSGNYRVVVGGFSSLGIDIFSSDFVCGIGNIGVAGFRKL